MPENIQPPFRVRLMTDEQILEEKFGKVSKATAYRRIFSHPDFPRPIDLCGKNLRPENEVDEFILKVMKKRR